MDNRPNYYMLLEEPLQKSPEHGKGRRVDSEQGQLMAVFRWRHFGGEIILWAVRWYCRYGISYRELEEMMGEREPAPPHRIMGVHAGIGSGNINHLAWLSRT
jgi:hypothetical protein